MDSGPANMSEIAENNSTQGSVSRSVVSEDSDTCPLYRCNLDQDLGNLIWKYNVEQGIQPPSRVEGDWVSVPRVSGSGKRKFTAQSGTTNDASIMKMNGETVYENIKFSDQHDPYLYDVEGSTDPTRKTMDADDATLEHFFSRPIKIIEERWDTGSNLFTRFDPWSLYLENPRVINRISNYSLLRASLRIKIIINGNGFQYGRAIASYLPYASFDSLSSNSLLVREDIVQASQQPHVYLDPTTSTGGEMKLPFFHHKNNLEVTRSEWATLGEMTIRSINQLKHANGAVDQATVSVFAWIEDVSMNVLTSVDPNTISPQSGVETEIDEANAKGVISGPATAVAKVAGALKVIPEIAPFAVATEAGATAVAKMAKSFGYCSPPVTKDPEPYKPMSHSHLATTTTPDQLQKLSLDDKQELSIDPRIAGLGGMDPLNIREIAKRESYLTTFSWNVGTTPETLLWNSRVTPVTWAESVGINTAMHFPACAMASLPFRYWTGKMKFRFQIVCSAFHKGRLKIVYDPNFLASNEYNTNYLQIVDIADKTDFTIEIGNGQSTNILDHARPGLESVTTIYSTTPYASRGPGNGVVGVYVVNELTTPSSVANNDIEVNVFVSAGDDFEVFVPDDHFQKFVFKPQSGAEIVPDSMNTMEPSAPQQSESENLGPGNTNHDLLGRVYVGESISSFRSVLKRYNLHSNLVFLPNNNPRVASGRRSMFPFLRGDVLGAVHRTDTGARYNYCNTVMLHWVTMAFSGWRGSIRWKILPRGPFNANRRPQLYVSRAPLGNDEYQQELSANVGLITEDQAAETVVVDNSNLNLPSRFKPPSGVNGACFTTGWVNPNLEFELPYYSPFRFTPGKTESYTGVAAFEEPWDYRFFITGNSDTALDAWCSAGEDFQTFFFTGLPRIYYEANPPVPNSTIV